MPSQQSSVRGRCHSAARDGNQRGRSEIVSLCDSWNHQHILQTTVVYESSSVSNRSFESDATSHHLHTHWTLCKQTLTGENGRLDHHHTAVNTDVPRILSCSGRGWTGSTPVSWAYHIYPVSERCMAGMMKSGELNYSGYTSHESCVDRELKSNKLPRQRGLKQTDMKWHRVVGKFFEFLCSIRNLIQCRNCLFCLIQPVYCASEFGAFFWKAICLVAPG